MRTLKKFTWANKVDILSGYLQNQSFAETAKDLSCYSKQIRHFILSKHFRGILLAAFNLAILRGASKKEIVRKLKVLKKTRIAWNHLPRLDPGELKYWRESVLARDNYTCQDCGKSLGVLQAHHIKLYAHYPGLRYNLANGLTLCSKCHANKHIGVIKYREELASVKETVKTRGGRQICILIHSRT